MPARLKSYRISTTTLLRKVTVLHAPLAQALFKPLDPIAIAPIAIITYEIKSLENGFISQQQPNGLNQLADHAYQQQAYGDQTNLDQAQRPSTSAVMPPPIKEEFPEFATQLFEPSDVSHLQCMIRLWS